MVPVELVVVVLKVIHALVHLFLIKMFVVVQVQIYKRCVRLNQLHLFQHYHYNQCSVRQMLMEHARVIFFVGFQQQQLLSTHFIVVVHLKLLILAVILFFT